VAVGWAVWPPNPIRPLLLGDGRDAAGPGMIRRYIIWRNATGPRLRKVDEHENVAGRDISSASTDIEH
jgi:hypothetical protein